MIKIEKTAVYGWDAAIRGMRNSHNSWDCGDSGLKPVNKTFEYFVGENDIRLMKTLAKSGDDHSKFARMINVACDIIAPLYLWKEFSTYKVGTVANSCSTMHTIQEEDLSVDDFSHEHLLDGGQYILNSTIDMLNNYRDWYLKTKDKRYWWQMIQLLPTSYNQKRTVQINYQVLWNIYKARKNHRLDEWKEFCVWIEKLPHFREIYLED